MASPRRPERTSTRRTHGHNKWPPARRSRARGSPTARIQCAGDDTRGALGKDGDGYLFDVLRAGRDVHESRRRRGDEPVKPSCALLKDGTVVCWGSNEHGELGQGTTDTDRHSVPVPVGF